MGMIDRLGTMFKAKANKVLDRIEDPRETLDLSYERQLQVLTKVRRALVDVATARKRLEMAGRELQAKAAKLHSQARTAMAAGRDDLAREALRRRAAIEPELASLSEQHAGLAAEEAKLTEACKRLAAQTEAFRARKETIKAQYSAAEATARAGDALAGTSGDLADVDRAVTRAEDRTAAMTARAGAIDALIATGALDDATVTPGAGGLDAELGRAVSAAAVEAELAAMRASLPGPGGPAGQPG